MKTSDLVQTKYKGNIQTIPIKKPNDALVYAGIALAAVGIAVFGTLIKTKLPK